jgi:hypothetical protein
MGIPGSTAAGEAGRLSDADEQALIEALAHSAVEDVAPEDETAEAAGQAPAMATATQATPFTREQLQELHKVALKTAERMGMQRDKASVVADAIVGAIVR